MKPVRLYIDNFMCYDKGYIDFTQFNAALIVGKVENNDLYSNGVGKTTIFKSIEYVLYNQAEVNLEKIVRDDLSSCQITFDFIVEGQEYRVIRRRTKKGSTDLSLFLRTAAIGSDDKVYHSIKTSLTGDVYDPFIDKKDMQSYWKDISGRRAADTEKELEKLIKINYKAFRSTIHFIQNDFSGIPTATPEKRKAILKEALNLIIYTKLEKIAKEVYGVLSKDIDKKKVLLENLGDPTNDLVTSSSQLLNINTDADKKQQLLDETVELFNSLSETISSLNNDHSNLESKFAALVDRDRILLSEKSRTETSIKEYQSKKNNITISAKTLIEEIASLKEQQVTLAKIDYSQIDILNEQIISLKEQSTIHNVNIQNNIAKIDELKIPIPKDAVCKHCRQEMSEKHKKECAKRVLDDLSNAESIIKKAKNIISNNNQIIDKFKIVINDLSRSKQKLEDINTKITEKNKEIQDKKIIHSEYAVLLTKFNEELLSKIDEINDIKEQLKNSSIEEAKFLKSKIDAIKKQSAEVNTKILLCNKEINHLNNSRAVIQHTIDQKTKDKLKQEELKTDLLSLEKKISIYPTVLQAFSSTGIPNLIIQNVLDDLQIEANNLLSQLKPGLQLTFFIEKTQGDGTEADTLDITYHINGKERYYEQLSGAMRLAVTFSLKLGLSFLLQKIIGTDIKFLLLDEIDQSLDKASVDAFADIVKFFQKDFTILIITHNDRLKNKFSHAILVEQDINMVSRAKVVSSW